MKDIEINTMVGTRAEVEIEDKDPGLIQGIETGNSGP